ncbi:SDR family NAD(P)-dependent oxidoreductase [Neolewinella antarctica]|uniref:NAD(P)-dependent dehydrogenase (Short-subunit alcohol dehydrogenase family) n=1 Tax=Neolewinella antarctica TaxID=442734 RepID=A0ABX0XA75_9BACT|nr:SDR family oxidoreductase [Neolewinella antarctica]NJC26127.1 NAD(P)-dependent dehydrogenase (short-subunit alcohol dehydrogenase family) [Neolewinella antarctica]
MSGSNPFSLLGRVTLVTGASSGIGRAIAVAVSKAGGHLIITGRSNERLRGTKDLLEPSTNCTILAGDLSDGEFLRELSKSVVKLDGVVLNAGTVAAQPLKFMRDEVIDEVMEVNLLAQMRLCRELYKAKKIKRGASLVMMSSISAAVGAPAHGLYAATKAGLTGFMRVLAVELGNFNIRVNCVAPAMIETEGIEKIYDMMGEEGLRADYLRYPLRRYGQPEEVAHPVVFLLSPAASYITGTTLTIDGGFTSR